MTDGLFGPEGPITTTDTQPRCRECNKMLAMLVTRPWVIQCSRCKASNAGLLPHQEAQRLLEDNGVL
jgi:phage FluMu protein Com